MGPASTSPSMRRVKWTPEEREARVRHRIDEVLDEAPARGREVVVLAAERHDAHVGLDAARPRHAVRVQPRAVDQHPRLDRPLRRLGDDRAVALDGRHQPRARHDPPALASRSPARTAATRRRSSRCPSPRRAAPPRPRCAARARAARRARARVMLRRPLASPRCRRFSRRPSSLLVGRDDDLAASLVRHAVLVAEAVERLAALRAQRRLQRTRRVVEARVDDAAVVARLVRGDRRLGLDDQQAIAVVRGEGQRGPEADDTAADDENVD